MGTLGEFLVAWQADWIPKLEMLNNKFKSKNGAAAVRLNLVTVSWNYLHKNYFIKDLSKLDLIHCIMTSLFLKVDLHLKPRTFF